MWCTNFVRVGCRASGEASSAVPATFAVGFGTAVLGLLGLAIGSFLNVVVARVPEGRSIMRPASHCPRCGHPIRAWHNVPVLGWLVLRGRCADCAEPISLQYPMVEAATAALFVALALRLAQLHVLAALPAYLDFAAAGLALALIDAEHRRLPDVIVLPSYLVIGLLLTAASAGTGRWWPLARAGLGAASLFGGYLCLSLVAAGAMGRGDVKLSGVVGGILAYLSWSVLIVGACAAFVLGAVVGVAVLIARGGGRRAAIAFGPFMIAGALLAVFAGDPIARAYLRLVGRG